MKLSSDSNRAQPLDPPDYIIEDPMAQLGPVLAPSNLINPLTYIGLYAHFGPGVAIRLSL